MLNVQDQDAHQRSVDLAKCTLRRHMTKTAKDAHSSASAGESGDIVSSALADNRGSVVNGDRAYH